MMPMGIERCGFRASSPVPRQKAASIPALQHRAGQLAPEGKPQRGLSVEAWGWAAAGRGCWRGGVPSRAAALAEALTLLRAEAHGYSPGLQACSCPAAGLTAPLAVLAFCPHQKLPLPAEPAEYGSSVCVGNSDTATVPSAPWPLQRHALPLHHTPWQGARQPAGIGGKEAAAGQPLGEGRHRQGGQAEQPVPATH